MDRCTAGADGADEDGTGTATGGDKIDKLEKSDAIVEEGAVSADGANG